MLGAFAISQLLRGRRVRISQKWKINVSSSVNYQIDVIFNAFVRDDRSTKLCPLSKCVSSDVSSDPSIQSRENNKTQLGGKAIMGRANKNRLTKSISHQQCSSQPHLVYWNSTEIIYVLIRWQAKQRWSDIGCEKGSINFIAFSTRRKNGTQSRCAVRFWGWNENGRESIDWFEVITFNNTQKYIFNTLKRVFDSSSFAFFLSLSLESSRVGSTLSCICA